MEAKMGAVRRAKKGRKRQGWVYGALAAAAIFYLIALNDARSFYPPYKSSLGTGISSSSAFGPSAPSLYSPSVLFLWLDEDEALLQRQADEPIYPASLTKMMTVLVALERLEDPEELVTLPESIFPQIWEANASTAGYQPNETVRAIDLCYAAMLPSGAEASLGLAVALAGSEEAFVDWMNQRAAQLEMTSTHFINVCGLQDENHTTTLRDLSKLLREALNNPTFREIFTTARHSTPPTNLHPDGITIYSTLFSKLPDASFPGGQILGGKTGFTDEAGLCLASLAEINGREAILLTAGAPGNHDTEPFHILDATAAYTWAGQLPD